MNKKFVLTPTAKNDLLDILADLAKDSPDAALSLREKFYDGFSTLGRSPGIGHYHDELLSRKYRFWNLYPLFHASHMPSCLNTQTLLHSLIQFSNR